MPRLVRAAQRRLQSADVEILVTTFGTSLLTDLEAAARRLCGSDCGRFRLYRRASISFLIWCVTSMPDRAGSAAVIRLFAGGGSSGPEAADTQSAASALTAWHGAMATERYYAPGYCHDLATSCASVLEQLGAHGGGGRHYPRYERAFFDAPNQNGHTPPLAELGLPELAGMPWLQAERAGLAMARERSLVEFDLHDKLFEFGRSVQFGAARDRASGTARITILGAMEAVREAVRSRRRVRGFTHVLWGMPSSVLEAETWAEAGLPSDCLKRWWADGSAITRRSLGEVALACLGASPGAFLAAAGVVVCDIGWNRQPTVDLPIDPFVFRTRNEFAIGTGAVVQCFKKRAGHEVVGFIDQRRPLVGILADRALSRWNEAVDEAGAAGDPDGHALLRIGEHDGTVRVLTVYGKLADASRAFDPLCARSPRLFVFPSAMPDERADGMRPRDRFNLTSSNDEFMRRLTFPILRKSFLIIHYGTGRSMAGTAMVSGNGQDVLWSNYLNTPDLRRDLLAGTEFLQATLQALISVGRTAPLAEAGADPATVEWFLRVAQASTVAAAFGIMPASVERPVGATNFNPTPTALTELFLSHWAARRAFLTLSPDAWSARCLPVLIVCKAIGSLVCRAGLRPAYVEAARAARRALSAGEIVLPPVEIA